MVRRIWILILAAVVLEAISCIQYFTSHAAIRSEAEQRAKTELRNAELEIEKHTVEMEAAAKMLAALAEKHLNIPDSIYAATRTIVGTIDNTSSVAVAFVPGFYKKVGKYFEACSSRISEDSIYTRQIGSDAHDYTQMEWYLSGFEHDSCWWCEPYLDDSGSQTMVVSCSYPVRDSRGEVVGVVCVDLSLEYLKDLSESLKVYPGSYSSIRSNKGTAIVPTPDTIPGKKYNLFGEEIDATGWHIEIIIPEEDLFKDLNRVGLLVGLLMILSLILVALILAYSARTTKEMIDFAEKNQRMESELEVAQTIQNAMLPKVFPPFLDELDVNIYGMVKPAKEIGGDLYDFYVRRNKLFFCVGDVSGKGIPASLVMATTRSLFRSITSHEENAAKIVELLNKAMCEQNEQSMFVTLFLGVLDMRTGKLDYCNAGHNAPAMVGLQDCKIALFDELLPNIPLGIEPEFVFKGQTMKMSYNETLFLYTDGLTEAENERHDQFGTERMLEKLAAISEQMLSPREMVKVMQDEVTAFVDGAAQSDDLTMLAIRYQIPALVMRNDIEQIPTLAEWVEGLELPMELDMPVNLALEEAVSNVMLYAYPGKHGLVFVECVKGKNVVFTITDEGIPFDPTAAPEADITLSAEERAIGGLGIHLVRQIMDEIRYERIENKNILTLVKKL